MGFSICMDSPVLTLVIALFFAIIVESRQLSKPHLPPQPESPSPSSFRSPAPESSTPPPLVPRPPPPEKPPIPKPTRGGNHRGNKDLSPPSEKSKSNTGKKIGLIFVGVASILQVCIVAFLLVSRRLLLITQTGYQRT